MDGTDTGDGADEGGERARPVPAATGQGTDGTGTIELAVVQQTSVAVALVADRLSDLPVRADLTVVRRLLEDLTGRAARQGARGQGLAAARSLQRMSGHLGVIADEIDLEHGPFLTEPADELREAAAGLRQTALVVDPRALTMAVRHVMGGRLDVLAAMPPALPLPKAAAGDLSRWLRRIRSLVRVGLDRRIAAAELRRVAAALTAVEPLEGGAGGLVLVHTRSILIRRTADWFQHPANSSADVDVAGRTVEVEQLA